MEPFQDLSPVDALRALSEQVRPSAPAPLAVRDIHLAYLAEDVEVSFPPARPEAPASQAAPESLALWNGYALKEEIPEGAGFRVVGVLSPRGELDAEGQPVSAPSPSSPTSQASPDFSPSPLSPLSPRNARSSPPPAEAADSAGASGAAVVCEPGLLRVETGAPLPAGTRSVLPVERTVLTGSDRGEVVAARRVWAAQVTQATPTVQAARALQPSPQAPRPRAKGSQAPRSCKPSASTSISTEPCSPAPPPPPRSTGGEGLYRVLSRPGRQGSRRSMRFPKGTPLGARLRSILESSGASHILAYPPFSVGFATIGDDLTDPAAAASTPGWPDLLAAALEEVIRAVGLEPVPLGILGDCPADLRAAVRRAIKRRIEVLLLSGGLGDGITDRTAESLKRLDARIVFAGRLFGPGSGFLLARVENLLVIALAGVPLRAAAQLDLLVRPALLARLGAGRSLWDWTRSRSATVSLGPLGHGATVGSGRDTTVGSGAEAPQGNALCGAWRVLPARVAGRGEGPSRQARALGKGEGSSPPPGVMGSAEGAFRVEALSEANPFVPTVPLQEGWLVIAPHGPACEPPQEAYFVPQAYSASPGPLR